MWDSMAIRFPNDDALRMALATGLVSPAVMLAPARCMRNSDGSILLAPALPIPETSVASLQAFGIRTVAVPPGGDSIAHWLQALPLRRSAEPPALTDQTPVLFELAAADAGELAGEMLRLGNDR